MIDGPAAIVLVTLGAVATLATTVPYAWDAATGRIPPSWVTWGIWTFTTGSAAIASVRAGAWVAAVVPGVQFFRCSTSLAATVLGMRHRRRERTSRFEWGCLGAAACCMVLAFAVPVLALVAAIATEICAAAPTYRNAIKGLEPVASYAGAFVFALTVVAVQDGYELADWLYPTYEMTLTGTLTVVTLLALLRRPVDSPTPPLPWRDEVTPDATARPMHLIVRHPDGRPDLTVPLCPEHAVALVALLADSARRDELIVMPVSSLRQHEELVHAHARHRR